MAVFQSCFSFSSILSCFTQTLNVLFKIYVTIYLGQMKATPLPPDHDFFKSRAGKWSFENMATPFQKEIRST